MTALSKNSTFTVVRFFLAGMVVIHHTLGLGGYGKDCLDVFSCGKWNLGIFAVYGFFSLSGYLIASSYEQSVSAGHYFWKRCLRLFPAFWIALLISAMVIAPLVYLNEHATLNGYFSLQQGGPVSYVLANSFLFINQWGIWDLWAHLPQPSMFNGSCWTLVYEFVCYAALFIVGRIGDLIFRNRFWAYFGAYLFFGIPAAIDTIPGRFLFVLYLNGSVVLFPVFFFAGATLFSCRRRLPFLKSIFLIATGVLIASLRTDLFKIFGPLCLTYVLVYMSQKIEWSKGSIDDYSYGVYIFSFPIQQILVYCGLNQYPWTIFFMFSMLCTLPIAILSWKFIEEPALKLKDVFLGRRFRHANTPKIL